MARLVLTSSLGAPETHRVSGGSRKTVAIVFGVIAAVVLLLWVASLLARWSGGGGGDSSD